MNRFGDIKEQRQHVLLGNPVSKIEMPLLMYENTVYIILPKSTRKHIQS